VRHSVGINTDMIEWFGDLLESWAYMCICCVQAPSVTWSLPPSIWASPFWGVETPMCRR